MTSLNFIEQANALRDELIARRRDLHRYPELAFEEVRTAGIVAAELNALGLEVQTGVGRTGVVGILDGALPGPTLLVRADMDALPVREANDVDYASTVPGKMHACGHDGHVTIALGVARLLAPHRDRMRGRIKFVFQPAEESGEGAKAMVADGLLTNPKPDVSLGLHLRNSMPLGTVGVTSGPLMAGVSVFDLKITGKGGHAASPNQNIDPVVCAAQVVSALQTVVSRNVDPFDTAVLSVTYLRAGEVYNVIPQDALLRGTFRFFKPEVRTLIERRMQEIADSLCAAMNCAADLTVTHQTNPVINDPDVSARLRDVFRPLIGDKGLDAAAYWMAGEDMSILMDGVPGTYFFVGAADPDADAYYGHHHPRFNFDENALPLGVALMTAAASSYVLPD